MYYLEPGQVVDYQVDYHFESYKVNPEQGEDVIHSDRIGEYKSEKVRISFDRTSAETDYMADQLQENHDIRSVDLNQLGYRVHLLREGHLAEKVFYGCKIIDCKKVFTVRSQYQLVNFTSYDYLIYFRCRKHFLLKYLESGDSLPLPRRLNDFKFQIKMIAQAAKGEKKPAGERQRPKLLEEELVHQEFIKDMRKTSHDLKNWSAAIPLQSVKGEKLGMEATSFLTCSQSLFTIIKKTRSDIQTSREAIDVNLVPPMIVRNCLPLDLTLKFVDSSGVPQEVRLEKSSERYFFCFNMAETVEADIEVQGFNTIKAYKLFNLEKYHVLEWALSIEDRYGRVTTIYARNVRKAAG